MRPSPMFGQSVVHPSCDTAHGMAQGRKDKVGAYAALDIGSPGSYH